MSLDVRREVELPFVVYGDVGVLEQLAGLLIDTIESRLPAVGVVDEPPKTMDELGYTHLRHAALFQAAAKLVEPEIDFTTFNHQNAFDFGKDDPNFHSDDEGYTMQLPKIVQVLNH